MNQPADFELAITDQGLTARLTGDWTALRMGWANERFHTSLD